MAGGALRKVHPSVTIVVLVTNSRYLEVLCQTIVKAFPAVKELLRHTKTLDEGRALALGHLQLRTQQMDAE
jgi:hypothetical protein